jgi:hypothetical protein
VSLPPLSAGTIDIHGVAFVRVSHLLEWLEEVAAARPEEQAVVIAIHGQVEQMLDLDPA